MNCADVTRREPDAEAATAKNYQIPPDMGGVKVFLGFLAILRRIRDAWAALPSVKSTLSVGP